MKPISPPSLENINTKKKQTDDEQSVAVLIKNLQHLAEKESSTKMHK